MGVSTLGDWVGKWKQLKNWVMQRSDTVPTDIVEGGFYYDNIGKKPMYYDGTKAKPMGQSLITSGVSSYPGPEWTSAGGASVTMSPCKCRLYDNANFEGDVTEYDIPSKTLTLTDNADQMCVIHYNNGTPEYALVDAWDIAAYNLSNVVTVYRFWYAFGDIHSASVDSLGLGLCEKQALRIGQTDYYRRIGGVGLEPSLTGLTLNVGGAGVWAGPVQMAIAAFASGTDSMGYIYKTSAGAWVSVDVTAVPNTLYNPSTGLATLSNSSKWTALYIYRTIGDAKECYIVLDTAEYNSETSAMESAPRADVPRIIQSHCVLVGRVLIQKSATTGTVESAWRTAFGTGGGVTTHNDLSGLQGGEIGYYGHLTAAQVAQAPRLLLGTCTTAQATTGKEVTLAGYTLNAGDVILVRFTYGSADTSTLNVNGTGAKVIYSLGGSTSTTTWAAGDFVCLLYDGGYWNVLWTRGSGSNMGTINLLAMKSNITELDANNVNYPVLWGTSNKLYQTAARLYFNPSTGFLQATKVGVIGGAATGFLKANGTVDSTTYAPKDHASSATTYGVATSGNYGHVKLYDLLSNGIVDGAPTVNAVYDAVTSLANSKQDVLTFDTTPTDGSTNPITSNGVFDALAGKAAAVAMPLGAGAYHYIKTLASSASGWFFAGRISFYKGAYSNEVGVFVIRFARSTTVGNGIDSYDRVRVSYSAIAGVVTYVVAGLDGTLELLSYTGYVNGDEFFVDFTTYCLSGTVAIGQVESMVISAGTPGWDNSHTNLITSAGATAIATMTKTPPPNDDSKAMANTAWVTSRAVPTIITANATLPAGAPIGKCCILESNTAYPNTVYIPGGETLERAGSTYPLTGSFGTAYSGAWFTKVTSTKWRVINANT